MCMIRNKFLLLSVRKLLEMLIESVLQQIMILIIYERNSKTKNTSYREEGVVLQVEQHATIDVSYVQI